jgi:hypothetical protein
MDNQNSDDGKCSRDREIELAVPEIAMEIFSIRRLDPKLDSAFSTFIGCFPCRFCKR